MKRCIIGSPMGTNSVNGDLVAFISGGDAALWTDDDGAPTVRTGGELVVGRSAGEIAIGGRSALNVMAHGIGIPVVTWEPCAERRHPIFGYPYGDETLTTTTLDAVAAVCRRIP